MTPNEEKRQYFRDAVRLADRAKNALWWIASTPNTYKLTKKQEKVIEQFREAYSALLGMYQDVENGRSE